MVEDTASTHFVGYLRRHMQTNPETPPLALCVIDVEASGFGRGSYPIEVGFVLGDGRAHCTLVRPAAHWTHWDDGAGRLHGITRTALEQHGRPAAAVAALLNQHLAGQVVYTDAWAHDYAWLATLYEEAELSPHFKLESVVSLLDQLRLSELPPAQRKALTSLGLTRHRASSDARALQMALQQVRGLAHCVA